MTAGAVVLLALSISAATWLCTAMRWRSRVAEREAGWRRAQAELLAEMASLRDEADRARIRAAQVTRDTTGWAEGYKQGCRDMIRAMAALQGGIVAAEDVAEEQPSQR